jgi:hypothetical protein
MWTVHTFLEVYLNNSSIKKIPITSLLIDNNLTIVSEDLVIKNELGWKNERYALIYPLFIPFHSDDIRIIIKKQHKYKVLSNITAKRPKPLWG